MTVLAVVEHRRGELRDVSFGIVTAGATSPTPRAGSCIWQSSASMSMNLRRLDPEGVDVVHTVAEGEEFNHDAYVQVIEALYDNVEPDVLLMPNSVNGLDYAPAVANGLSLPLVTDAIALDGDGTLEVTREMYGSKVETVVEVDADRAALTIQPGEWLPAEATGEADIREFDFEVDESAVRSKVAGFQEVGGGDFDITGAEVLVSVGWGIEEDENTALVQELADTLDATLSSRSIVDDGWLPKNRQVSTSQEHHECEFHQPLLHHPLSVKESLHRKSATGYEIDDFRSLRIPEPAFRRRLPFPP